MLSCGLDNGHHGAEDKFTSEELSGGVEEGMYMFGEHKFGYTEEYGHRGMDHGINKGYKPDEQEFDNHEVNMYWELRNTNHEVWGHQSKTQKVSYVSHELKFESDEDGDGYIHPDPYYFMSPPPYAVEYPEYPPTSIL